MLKRRTIGEPQGRRLRVIGKGAERIGILGARKGLISRREYISIINCSSQVMRTEN